MPAAPSAVARRWLFVLLLVVASVAAAAPGRLHVPSPDWRDQVVYFVVTDRFDDGDPRNNDQGATEYDPGDGARYSGGDFAGLLRRLDYIRNLGATAVWITPPVANQWWNPRAHYGGYHGYWATDFSKVDPHLGTLADYQRLSAALHARGMYLVQDIVLNHTADFFRYDASRDATDPARGYSRLRDAQGREAPTQWPFSLNDPRDPAQRNAAIYHWTPDIADYADPVQLRDWQLAGLDDIDTETPLVARALRDTYGDWIRRVGVDAFRVDTAFYVPPSFFRGFLHADDPRHPGILRVAEGTGRRAFHVFGEGFALDRPYEDAQARRIDTYLRDAQGPLLPGMLAFPLYGTANDVFARGHPTRELAWRIDSLMRTHASPWLMPTFLDNHDVDRFLAGGDAAGLRQGLLLLMTLPGIPVVYYGTEQGFTGQRDAMFARGFGAGGRDHFDARAPLYRYLQRAIALRRQHRVFSRGTPTVLRSNAAGPGVLAYRMLGVGEDALVAFNTGTEAALLDGVDTGLPPGTVLRGAFAIDGRAPDVVVDARGRATLPLPPRSGYAWLATRARRAVSQSRVPVLAPLPAAQQSGDVLVEGVAPGAAALRVVVDGGLAGAQTVHPDASGRWQARIDTASMIDPAIVHDVVAWDPVTNAVSAPQSFRVARAWTLLADVADPQGDDTGPQGNYRYPTGTDWDAHPGDLARVRVFGIGGALRVELTLRALSTAWNPPNGFDHVAFTLYLQLPGEAGGARVMPLQQATLPDGMHWHRRLRANGWSNLLSAADGATATAEGRVVVPGAALQADAAARTVTFTLPAAALGARRDLSGAKLYVTTWDYDGGYRPLQPQAGPHAFGGGSDAEARVMDAVLVELR